ncbi:MAG: S8 family serine peptidase [Planctomycetes bacterium]|nr:S8 family serine peptidase [Planctomycetota bacterium]
MKGFHEYFFGAAVAASTAFQLCPDLPAQGQDLLPRTPYPKQVLVSRPGYQEFLTVKFVDEVQARAAPDGGLISRSGMDLVEVMNVAVQHGISFFPSIDVPEETLAALTELAAANTGVVQADLAGILTARLPEENPEEMIAAGNALQAQDEVEYAYIAAQGVPPPSHTPTPASPNYVPYQDYREPDPGMNMDLAWTKGATRGKGIRLTDCEYNWNLIHEDLHGVPIALWTGVTPAVTDPKLINHGTAVLGIICAQKNSYGCTGLAPDAEVRVYPEDYLPPPPLGTVPLYTCVTKAIDDSSEGDVVLLEMQLNSCMTCTDYIPAESDPNLHALVITGTGKKIIVVAAAGNGNQNLDGPSYTCMSCYMKWADSGAIIVGAGMPTTSHDKHSSSTYGSRVNVQGWGEMVTTLGYGTNPMMVSNSSYTGGFQHTSAASAMAAAACASLQSFAVDRLCRRLTPAEMRWLLINSGTPQGTGGHVGPFLNMPAAQQLLVQTYPSLCKFRRGDANNDGNLDISDCIYTAGWLFLGYEQPPCLESADVNDDGIIELLDAINLCTWMFMGTAPPPAPPPPPFPCGPDPAASPYNLGCASSICP